jgi:hypothetical protein
MSDATKPLDPDAARALLGSLADTLADELTEIADDDDDATKMDRAAALIEKSTPEVTAVVVLGLLGSVREYEERFSVYESLIAKISGPVTGEA